MAMTAKLRRQTSSAAFQFVYRRTVGEQIALSGSTGRVGKQSSSIDRGFLNRASSLIGFLCWTRLLGARLTHAADTIGPYININEGQLGTHGAPPKYINPPTAWQQSRRAGSGTVWNLADSRPTPIHGTLTGCQKSAFPAPAIPSSLAS